MTFLRTDRWKNGDHFSPVSYFECDHCKAEICEADPHSRDGDRHYCFKCSFIVGHIDEQRYLKWSGMSGMPRLRAEVKDGDIVVWTTKKPPWEIPDKEFRKTKAYREWRQSVLLRDEHTCQHCGSKDKLQAHHIKPFAKYVKQRYKVANGLTLCEPCHRKVHSKREKKVSG